MDKQSSIVLISHNDKFGGAARAVLRLFKCLHSNNSQVRLIVMNKYELQSEIVELSLVKKFLGRIFSVIDTKLSDFLIPECKEWKTSAFFGVLKSKDINKIETDVINLHWLGHGLISLRQLKKIKKPIIWTLQDEWALHPINHFPVDVDSTKKSNKARKYITGHVLEQRAKQKRNFILKDNVSMVTLSSQMKSKLLQQYPEKMNRVFTIANPVSLSSFNPSNRNFYTDSLGISRDKPTLLFLGGTKNMRKGWDLLEEAIKFTRLSFNLIVIGGTTGKILSHCREVDIVGLKKISDLNNLIDLYITSEAVIVPSRIEGLPQTATESLSCGTPVIGFKIGGLMDIIINDKTGYVVEPYDVQELGSAIDRVINVGKRKFENNCRDFAEKEFACHVVSSKYNSVFTKNSDVTFL